MNFGERIKSARTSAGLTQVELCEAIRKLPSDKNGVFSQQTISKLEQGRLVSYSWISHISYVTKVDYKWLAFGITGEAEKNSINDLGDWIGMLRQLSREYELSAGGMKLPDSFHDNFLECGLLLSVSRSLPKNDKERKVLLTDIKEKQISTL